MKIQVHCRYNSSFKLNKIINIPIMYYNCYSWRLKIYILLRLTGDSYYYLTTNSILRQHINGLIIKQTFSLQICC